MSTENSMSDEPKAGGDASAEPLNIAPDPDPTPETTPDPAPDARVGELEGKIQELTAQLERANASVAGSQQFYEALKKRGFEKPDDLGQLDPLLKAVKDKGMTPAQLAAALEGDDDDPKFDVESLKEALKKEIFGEVEQRQGAFKATQEYEAASKAESGLLDQLANQIAESTGIDRAVVADAVRYRASESRDLYPEDHPLASTHFRPLDRASVEQIGKALMKQYGVGPKPAASDGERRPPDVDGPETPKSLKDRLTLKQRDAEAKIKALIENVSLT